MTANQTYESRWLVWLASVVMVFLISSVNAASDERGEWVLAEETKGVSVYSREVSNSEYKEFKATTRVDVELNQLMALMDDTNSYTQWMHNTKAAQLISKASPIERHTYLVNDLPWPLTDRDVLVKVNIEQEEFTRVVTLHLNGLDAVPETLAERMPKRRGREPIKTMQGIFKFTPISETATDVEYQLFIELGGVPASVANGRIMEIPLNTLKNMKNVAPQPQYSNFKPF